MNDEFAKDVDDMQVIHVLFQLFTQVERANILSMIVWAMAATETQTIHIFRARYANH